VINEQPLFIREYSKNLLFTSVWKDTSFLSQLNVMDYSLVVGVDSDTHELIIGIVGKVFYLFIYLFILFYFQYLILVIILLKYNNNNNNNNNNIIIIIIIIIILLLLLLLLLLYYYYYYYYYFK